MSGQKLIAAYDAVWLTGTTRASHRSYQYYSTSPTEIQQWWDPRIDLVDGNEPSIAALIAGHRENTLDLTRSVKVGIKPSVLQNQSEFIIPTAEDEITVDASNLNFSTEQTIIQVLKPTSAGVCNPYEQAYGGFGTITKYPNGTFIYFHGSSGINTSPYDSPNSQFTVEVNETAFIAVTRDTNPSAGIKWYKNGQFVVSTVNNYPTKTNYLNHIIIGNGYVAPWLGSIYVTLVYNRALSAAEIKQNFESLRGRYGL